MTATIQSIIDSARLSLIDVGKTTWSDVELVQYANEGIQATCSVKPDAYIVTGDIVLVSAFLQTLPAGGTGLLDVVRNTVSLKAVTQVDKAMIEAADPALTGTPAAIDIEHYAVDPRNPLIFFTYPIIATGASVRAIWTAIPATVAAGAQSPLVDSYSPIIVEYVMYRAYGKDTKRQDLTKSAFHKQQWGSMLGLKAQVQVTQTPTIREGTPT